MLSVVLEELESAGQGGGVLGFPLMRLKATVLGGEVGETGPTEIAFRTATNHAFDAALREARPVLLEPIMRLEINTPDEHVGDLVSDLQQRRAIIHQNRVSRHQHRAPRRSTAGKPVRLLQRDAQPEPRAGQAARWNQATTPRPRMMCCRSFWESRDFNRLDFTTEVTEGTEKENCKVQIAD